MHLFDSHLHLQEECFSAVLSETIQKAQNAGILYLHCCGTNPQDWPIVADLHKKYPFISISFGVHPWFVDALSDNWIEQLHNYLTHYPAGIGEIGLDFTLKGADRDRQENIFLMQLSLAKQLNRPVSIHCSKAWDTFIQCVEKSMLPKGSCMIHSFSGSEHILPFILEKRIYISFSGSITYKSEKKIQLLISKLPIDQILIETDSPAQIPKAAKRNSILMHNEPYYLSEIIEKLSVFYRIDVSLLAKIIFENSITFFKRIGINEFF